MPVTRRLMKPGSWSLRLRDNTPRSLYSQIDRGDLMVLLPNRLQPVEGFTDASLRAAALAAGTITAVPSSTDLRGHGLEWWMGTPKGYGPGTAGTQGLLTTPVAFTAGTLSQWVTALCPPGLTVGTVTNGALPTLSNSYQFVTRREALDDVCRKIGAEYRVNPDGTVDAAAPSTLFGSTATVVVTRKEEGRDGPYRGLQGSVISTSRDIEEFVSKAIVVTRGTGQAATATTSTGSTLFRDPQGNLCHVERYIDAPSELAANAGLIGNAALNRFNTERRDLRLSSKTYNVSRFAEPGDYVFAYDAADGLVDAANQVIYRGEVITPLMLRVFGLTFPIEAGSGVYVRKATGVGTYRWVDLSDHVVWETGEVSWEVGAPRRPLAGTAAGPVAEGTVAYLGVNPAISTRATPLRTPGVRVRRSATYSLPDNTVTVYGWDVADYDTHEFHDLGLNYRFVCPAGLDGTYAVGYTFDFADTPTGVGQAWLTVNGGAARLAWGSGRLAGALGGGLILNGHDFVYLAAGDYVELFAYQNSGGAIASGGTGVSWFMYRLGD